MALLNGCIETPEPVHIQIGVKEMSAAGEHLSLITAPYSVRDQGQGSLGVLGPMRMRYERAITAVAYVAQVFSDTFTWLRTVASVNWNELVGTTETMRHRRQNKTLKLRNTDSEEAKGRARTNDEEP